VKVLILGGYGTFGRLISERLAQVPSARVVVAGRHADNGSALAESLGVELRRCDVKDPVSLKETIDGAFLVLNASGPFKANDYSIPLACIDAGCHYIDIADGRNYVSDIVQLNEKAIARNVFVCAGASTTPAITSALVEELRPRLSRIRTIQVALNAGNKNSAGVSTIATIMSYVGGPVQVWQGGEWRTMRGWSAGEFATFPAPVGRRRVQLCDVPDLALFPKHFQAESVIFKAGVELTILNYAIGTFGIVRRVVPSLNLAKLARPLVIFSKMFKPLGTLHGGCAVWVTDIDGHQESLAVVAHENGPRIPGSPAVLLAQKLLTGQTKSVGAFPCMGFLNLAEFAEFLAPYRIIVVRGSQGVWQSNGCS
jgi:hypothetical protein